METKYIAIEICTALFSYDIREGYSNGVTPYTYCINNIEI